ncbi:hypothetical protein [Pseudofrankia sp. BMG5.36]|uniref:hypothetical protein n=1 Tax=Pseudofrankia sp. BMG5.36 TaxID=1834512 RepID=UPI001042495A|nr:hypothetical protein [Pseudofrankia sp. BMG5.36]
MKVSPGTTAANLVAQAAHLPDGAMFLGAFGDLGVVLAFGPADGSASDRDVLTAVVAALAPQDFAGGRERQLG